MMVGLMSVILDGNEEVANDGLLLGSRVGFVLKFIDGLLLGVELITIVGDAEYVILGWLLGSLRGGSEGLYVVK